MEEEINFEGSYGERPVTRKIKSLDDNFMQKGKLKTIKRILDQKK